MPGETKQRGKATETTRGIMTRRHAARRMDLLRRENVKRHNEFAARTKLKMDQVRAQRVATMQMELDRLHEAAIRGSGLDAVQINRMNALKEVIGSYKQNNVGGRPTTQAAL